MRTAKGDCLLTNVTLSQVGTLETTFAIWRPKGCHLPEWVTELHKQASSRVERGRKLRAAIEEDLPPHLD